VASAVAREVMAFQASDGTLGAHLADQWMLPLALAVAAKGDGASFTCSEMTEHARTNMGVIEKFLAVRFMAEASGSAWRVGLARR
jgi:RNA 3'-terminal phosphate cyclase (ATP)